MHALLGTTYNPIPERGSQEPIYPNPNQPSQAEQKLKRREKKQPDCDAHQDRWEMKPARMKVREVEGSSRAHRAVEKSRGIGRLEETTEMQQQRRNRESGRRLDQGPWT